MEIVDSQVHANHRGIDQSIAIMDAVGVQAAVIDIWPPVRRKLPNGVTRFEYLRRRGGSTLSGTLRLCRALRPQRSGN
jgi:hypothetical protein